MTAEYDEIQAFLSVHAPAAPHAPEIRKAGIVPFLRAPLRYCVMTPVANKPHLGMPEFQLCKGTRMFESPAGWQDMRGEVPHGAPLESLPQTALREGIEELGLKLSNIETLLPLGDFTFISASNRKEITLWMCAALVKSETDFGTLTPSTDERAWMTLAEFHKRGRVDHAHVLSQIEERLACM